MQEVSPEGPGGRVPIVARTRHRSPQDGLERRREIGAKVAGGPRIFGQNLQKKGVVVRCEERPPPREALVEHHAARIHVDPRIEASLAARLLGRHVVRGPHHHARPGQIERFFGAARHPLRDAEVEDLRDRIGVRPTGKEDVFGLDVPMHDPLLVRSHEARQHLGEHVDRLEKRKASRLADAIGEGLAMEPFHDEVRAAVLEPAHVVDLADVRVSDSTRRTRLLLEALYGVLLFRLQGVQHLHGDGALEAEVLRFVHDAHAAGAEDRDHAVAIAEDLPDEAGVVEAEGLERSGRARREAVVGRGASSLPCGLGRTWPFDAHPLARGGTDGSLRVVRRTAMRAANEPLTHRSPTVPTRVSRA